MKAFTGDEKNALYDEALALLKRAQELLLKARGEHEQMQEFIKLTLPDNPTSGDWRAAINAYKAGRVHQLPPFGDSQRMVVVNPAPDAAAPAVPTETMGFITIARGPGGYED